jgi:hypothetical protein
LSLFNELLNPFEAARDELELGLLYREKGMHPEARAQLEASQHTFTKLGAQLEARRAGDALKTLEPA